MKFRYRLEVGERGIAVVILRQLDQLAHGTPEKSQGLPDPARWQAKSSA